MTPGLRGGPANTRYKFDRTFGKQSTQEDIYADTKTFIDASLQGFNSTLFAYGQTGTGKTHTMLGVDLWEMAAQGEHAYQIDEDKRWYGDVSVTVSVPVSVPVPVPVSVSISMTACRLCLGVC